MKILGIDPSLSACGVAILDATAEGLALHQVACWETISTVSMGKGRAVAHQHDAARRGTDIATHLSWVLSAVPEIEAIGIECPTAAQSAAAAWALARAHQAVHVAVALSRPQARPFSVSAHQAKRWAAGRPAKRGEDSKALVRDAMRRLFGPTAWSEAFRLSRLTTKAQKEAAYDAAAVAALVAAQPSVIALVGGHHG